ncbi:helix-turn-helix transcriptional regulator [Pediococcus acidilactici]|uniref:helix-turn-helix domain-containing protein n=1 Tax=Pediococcus acidilactici TaxID=1254 RepID=UPI002F2672C4
MIVFERIKELAQKQSKSINDVENDLGYSQNTLYRLKRSNPSAKKLKEIADYFKVSTDYLLGRTDDPKMGSSDMTENQKLIAHSIDPDVTDEEREAIINMVKEAMKFRRRL